MYKIVAYVLTVFAFLSFTDAVDNDDKNNWELQSEDDGIEVYLRDRPGDSFKEIKIVAQLKTGLNELMAALNDIEAREDWVYKCPEARLLQQVDKRTMIYYVRSNFPYPIRDRDIVIQYTWEQDPMTKVIVTRSKAVDGIVKNAKSTVRISKYQSNYVLTPLKDGTIHIEYVTQLDPAGSLPSWLVNKAITKGPIKSMNALFDILLHTERYKGAKVEGVQELSEGYLSAKM